MRELLIFLTGIIVGSFFTQIIVAFLFTFKQPKLPTDQQNLDQLDRMLDEPIGGRIDKRV